MMRRDAMGRFRPVSRNVRFNPYEKVGKYVGRKFSVARGPRAGDFEVLGRGIGNTAAIEYAGGDVGTYAVKYDSRKQPRYYPNRYISQLAYRRSEKGLAALARARKAAAKARKEAAKAERASETAKEKAKKAKEKAKEAERQAEAAIATARPANDTSPRRRRPVAPPPAPSFAERFGAGSPEPLRPRTVAPPPAPSFAGRFGAHARRVLEYLSEIDENEAPSSQISWETGLTMSAVNKALDGLRRGGFVVETTTVRDTRTGDMEDVWNVTSNRGWAKVWVLRSAWRQPLLANGREPLPEKPLTPIPDLFRRNWEAD